MSMLLWMARSLESRHVVCLHRRRVTCIVFCKKNRTDDRLSVIFKYKTAHVPKPRLEGPPTQMGFSLQCPRRARPWARESGLFWPSFLLLNLS